MKPMLRRMQSVFDHTHCEHDNADDHDNNDDVVDDDDGGYAIHLKSMHPPPDKMKGHAIRGIPPSSEIEQLFNVIMIITMLFFLIITTYVLLLNSVIERVIQNSHCHIGFCLPEGICN